MGLGEDKSLSESHKGCVVLEGGDASPHHPIRETQSWTGGLQDPEALKGCVVLGGGVAQLPAPQ